MTESLSLELSFLVFLAFYIRFAKRAQRGTVLSQSASAAGLLDFRRNLVQAFGAPRRHHTRLRIFNLRHEYHHHHLHLHLSTLSPSPLYVLVFNRQPSLPL
jgi:hypothetical protein